MMVSVISNYAPPSSTPNDLQAISEDSMLSRELRKDGLIISYCRALHEARWAARINGFLHTLSTFLAYCNLTWASLILLGAFASDLHFGDYSFVIALLLLEATRLASTSFFTELLTRSHDPGHLSQATADHFSRHRNWCHLSPFLQVLLIIPSFFGAILRLRNTRFYNPGSINQLQMSLRIFYGLVILNSALSSLNLLCSILARKRFEDPKELSILRYYDEAVRNALVNGIIQADNFNFFQFVFKYLGREHARCQSWKKVVEGHRKLLKYIYVHKQGADYLQICLDSEDASVRQAAANMVGMWADEGRGVGIETRLLQLPPELLTKLADMVGTGEIGWAATNSFGALAKRNPQYLVQTLTSGEHPVLHKIAKQVDEFSTRSLAPVRTLVLFYNQIFLRVERGAAMAADRPPEAGCVEVEQVVRNLTDLLETALPAADIRPELVRKLKHLLSYSQVQRLKVQSAFLLYLLGALDDPCYHLIAAIDPQKDLYWYEMEQKMLEFFVRAMPSHPPLLYPAHVWSDHETIFTQGPNPFPNN